MQNVLCTFSSPSCPPQSPRKSRDSYPWRPRNYAKNVNKSPVLTKIALTVQNKENIQFQTVRLQE